MRDPPRERPSKVNGVSDGRRALQKSAADTACYGLSATPVFPDARRDPS